MLQKYSRLTVKVAVIRTSTDQKFTITPHQCVSLFSKICSKPCLDSNCVRVALYREIIFWNLAILLQGFLGMPPNSFGSSYTYGNSSTIVFTLDQSVLRVNLATTSMKWPFSLQDQVAILVSRCHSTVEKQVLFSTSTHCVYAHCIHCICIQLHVIDSTQFRFDSNSWPSYTLWAESRSQWQTSGWGRLMILEAIGSFAQCMSSLLSSYPSHKEGKSKSLHRCLHEERLLIFNCAALHPCVCVLQAASDLLHSFW